MSENSYIDEIFGDPLFTAARYALGAGRFADAIKLADEHAAKWGDTARTSALKFFAIRKCSYVYSCYPIRY